MAGKLRKYISDAEITEILEKSNGSLTMASEMASQHIGAPVSIPLMSQWAHSVDYSFIKESEPQKVLLFDIETTPILAYTWGLWNQNIPIGAIQKDWQVMCWSAKWLGQKTMYNSNFIDFDEKTVVEHLWNLLDEADVVVAHNGKQFDVKKMNAKFLEFGLGNPSYYKTVDTLQIVKGNLSLTSNKLDWVAKFIDEDRKNKVDFDIWLRCMDGDKKAMKTMQKYCDQDVNVLERVYLRIRYLDKNTPAYIGGDKLRCNACGSTDLVWTSNKLTASGIYQVYTCCECTHNVQAKGNIQPKHIQRGNSV